MLDEQRALVCSQCLAHTDLSGLAEKFREQQTDSVEQADSQQHRRQSGQNSGLVRQHLLFDHPLFHIE